MGALPEEGRAPFFEALAHSLTFVISRILSEEGPADGDKLGRVGEVNVLLREVLATGRRLRLRRVAWSEWGFADLIRRYVSEKHPSGTLVRWAIERSHREVRGDGT